MFDRLNLLVVCGMPLAVALPHGVKLPALGLEEGASSARLWSGLPLLLAGILGLECVRHSCVVLSAEAQQPAEGKERDPRKVRELLRIILGLHILTVLCLQFISVFRFIFLLDGHVHLRACCWLYLVYAAGALLVLAGRQTWTRWGSCYLRWGWAPLIAFGVPLSLPTLKAAGLVPFSPLSW